MTDRAAPTFHQLDLTLGHLLRADADRPWTVALRVLPAALRRGYPAPVVRRWVASRAGRDVAALATSPTWHRAVAASRQLVRGTATENGLHAKRLQVARRMVGRLLAPVPVGVTPLGAQGARMVVVAVGLEALARLTTGRPEAERIDTPRLSRGAIAVRLGVAEPTAQRWLTTAERLGWLGAPDRSVRGPGGHGTGHAAVRRLTRLDAAAGETAWGHAELVDALAAGEDDTAATLVLAATHPAWGYSLGHRAWLVAVAQAVGVDPVARFGVPVRTVRAAVVQLDRTGLDRWAGEPDGLTARLDELAHQPGPDGTTAVDRHREALARQRAAAAERKAAVEAARAARAEQRQAAAAAKEKAAVRRAGPAATVPAVETKTVRLPSWWTGPADRDRLVTELAARGYGLVDLDDARGVAVVRAN